MLEGLTLTDSGLFDQIQSLASQFWSNKLDSPMWVGASYC